MKQFLLSSALLLAIANAGAAECSIGKAIYELQGDPAVTVKFTGVTLDSAARTAANLTLKKTGKTLGFLVEQGNGMYSYAHWMPLAPVKAQGNSRPEVTLANADLAYTMDFFMMSGDHKVTSHIPKLDEQAPAYLFVPGLAPNLWYQPEKFGGSANKRDQIALGLFVRRCQG